MIDRKIIDELIGKLPYEEDIISSLFSIITYIIESEIPTRKGLTVYINNLSKCVSEHKNKMKKHSILLEENIKLKRRINELESEHIGLLLRASTMKDIKKMCLGKKSFRTKNKALEIASKFGGDYGIYECPICHCYHITTKPNKKYGTYEYDNKILMQE